MEVFHLFVALCILCEASFRVSAIECPEVKTVEEFDVSKYLGKWYETERHATEEIPAECVTVDCGIGENKMITMINSFKNILGYQKAHRIARIPDLSEPGKLKTRYPLMPAYSESDYWILGTDYESYAVVFGCKDAPLVGGMHISIFTRERNPSDSVLAKAFAVVEKNNLREYPFANITQTSCTEE